MPIHYDLNWLLQKQERGETLKFLYFWGHTNKTGEETGKFCLSQWYISPFTVDGRVYPSAEHWMMAHKALLFEDKVIFEAVLKSGKPAEVKDLGRKIQNFDPLLWDKEKFEIVKQGNIHKFGQNPLLLQYLLQLENRIIVEASPVDRVWGIGMAQDNPDIHNVHAWKGQNLLGFALMEARDFLRDNEAGTEI